MGFNKKGDLWLGKKEVYFILNLVASSVELVIKHTRSVPFRTNKRTMIILASLRDFF